MGVSKNRGGFPPEMDGETNEKPYFLMDDLGGPPIFLETSICNKMPFIIFVCGFKVSIWSGT